MKNGILYAMKTLLPKLVALVLVACLLPVCALAEEADTNGDWVNFLLICNEGMNNDKGNAGNTLMVVAMNPVIGKIRLLSFTWDTFVDYEGYDVPQKLDMPYRNNGPEEAMKVFNANFGTDIQYYMSLNYLNLASLIDEYNGVNVDKALHIQGKKGCGVSMAILDSDGDFCTYCAGSGRFGEDFPVNPDMLFQAGSVSKPAFATTLLRYVDKGKIDLDADISGVVSDIVKKGPLTFAALLSHTAGYNVHGFPGYPAAHEPLSLEDVLLGKGNTPKLRRIRPDGQQYMYSGGGITLAELAFTRITGMTLRDAFQKEVAEPLGLKRTGYFQPLDEDKLDNAAFGGRLAQKEDAAHGFHYYPEHAAAGLWTTPTELCKLGVALSRSYRRGGFLKKKTVRRMMTPVLDNYGLCIYRGVNCPELAFHGGWNEGFLTEWNFSLKEDLCVASMINRASDAIDEAHAEAAFELYKNAKE